MRGTDEVRASIQIEESRESRLLVGIMIFITVFTAV